MSKLVDLFEKNGSILKLRKGRMLFGVDDPATKMFLVKTGAVKIYRYSDDGKEIMFYISGPDELITITPYLKGVDHLAYAETMIDSEISWIPMPQFKSLVNKDPEILLEISKILAHKWDEVSDRVEAFVTRDSTGRLAYMIFELINKYGLKENSKVRLAFPLTHQDFANLTGMFRETVSIAMQELVKAKAVSREKQFLVVENLKILEEYSRYGRQADT